MREKLIELLSQVQDNGAIVIPTGQSDRCELVRNQEVADQLIAKGATIPVRCKDCKGWCTEEIAKHYGVERYCTMTMMSTNADDFCSYGERRTDG